jgi:SAM-dependent methyltransferase
MKTKYRFVAKLSATITPHLPFSLYKAGTLLYTRLYMPVLCQYTEWQESKNGEQKKFEYLPPPSLRYRVNYNLDKDSFMEGGMNGLDIVTLLKKVDKNLDSFNRILDFGCGCGRTLYWVAKYSNKPDYYGTDIDVQAISWSHKNLNFAKFSVNKALQPLVYKSETFDLVYALSVFTHLDEERQFVWLTELKRILKPRGILIITLHGRRVSGKLPYDVKKEFEKIGFLYLKSGADLGIFPDWYQNAFHTQEYVIDKYANHFKILNYFVNGMSNNQDAVILQKI